jgi:hypothetical protein
METVLVFLAILGALAVAFACGYAVRDRQSRRRSAAEREKFHQRHPEYGPYQTERRGGSRRISPSRRPMVPLKSAEFAGAGGHGVDSPERASPTKCGKNIVVACWPNHIAIIGAGSLQVAVGRCGYSTDDLHKKLMIRRVPVLISTVTAMPGDRLTSRSSTCICS